MLRTQGTRSFNVRIGISAMNFLSRAKFTDIS